MNTIKNPITGRDKLIVTGDGVYDAITGRQVGIIENGVVKSTTTGAAIAVVINNGGTVDLSFITATAGDILSGKVGADTDGNPVNGTITQKSAATFTPSTKDQTIAAGTYLTGVQTIKGEPNWKEENIADGVSMWGKVGTFKGGGSFAKVTAFTAPYDAYSAVSAIEVSGIGEVETWDGMQDFSNWNGTYNVTPSTASEQKIENKVFKHTSQNKYIYRIYDEEYGDSFWVMDTTLGTSYVYSAYFASRALESGTWYLYEYDAQTSLTISKIVTDYPAQELVLNAVSATFEEGAWSTGSSVTLTGYEKEPIVDGIYMYSESRLIGDALACGFEKWMPTDGLLCYFPMTNDGIDRVSGVKLLASSGAVQFTESGVECATDGAGLFGFNSEFEFPEKFTIAARVRVDTPTDYKDAVAAIFDTGSNGDGEGAGLIVDTNRSRIGYHWDSGHSPYDGWGGAYFGISYNIEYHVALSYDGSRFKLFENGVAVSDGDERTFKPSRNIYVFGGWENRGGFPGKIADILLYDRALTDDDIQKLSRELKR